MKLIEPHKKKSNPVLKYSQIREEAKELIELIDARNFEGRWKDAFALHHSQVSKEPYNFFVVHKNLVKGKIHKVDREELEGEDKHERVEELKKESSFRHRIIINPEIVEVDKTYRELTKEACMGFPHRKKAKLKRYVLILVKYQTPRVFGFGLKWHEDTVAGVVAQIFQHELDHAEGRSIYDRAIEVRKEKKRSQKKKKK